MKSVYFNDMKSVENDCLSHSTEYLRIFPIKELSLCGVYGIIKNELIVEEYNKKWKINVEENKFNKNPLKRVHFSENNTFIFNKENLIIKEQKGKQ
ncbi:hypothetical protein NUSPORA_02990 [Nucleospora cyclopteri]